MLNSYFSILATATATTADAEQAAATANMISIGIMVIFFAILYFFMIRPQKKKEKEQKAMRDNLQIGDEVATIGGIVGIVVRKGEDTVVIETGGDRSKIRVKTWAISENMTKHDAQDELGKKK